MARVLLAGAFGQRNPGDEALLEAFLRALSDCDLVVTTARPGWTEYTYGCDAVDSGDPWAVGQALRGADVIVIGGGTIFKTLHPSAGRAARSLLTRSLALVTSARTLGRRVAAVGVGVGQLPDPVSRWLARELVRRIDLLVLRDEESAHLLRNCGAPTPFRVGSDPAWTLLNPPLHTGGRHNTESRHSGRDDTILVALSHLAASGRELWSLLDRLADALTEQAADGLQVLLQPWQVGTSGMDDHAIASYLHARLDGSIVLPPPADLTEARASAASARLLVAMRFHALVAGAAAGAPVVAVAHEAKLAGLARRLGQPAVRTDASTGELAAAMRRARSAGGTAPASVQAETAQAEEGFRLLRLLIDHERWDETDTLTGLRLEPAWWAARPHEPGPSASPPSGTDWQLTGHVPVSPPSGSP